MPTIGNLARELLISVGCKLLFWGASVEEVKNPQPQVPNEIPEDLQFTVNGETVCMTVPRSAVFEVIGAAVSQGVLTGAERWRLYSNASEPIKPTRIVTKADGPFIASSAGPATAA